MGKRVGEGDGGGRGGEGGGERVWGKGEVLWGKGVRQREPGPSFGRWMTRVRPMMIVIRCNHRCNHLQGESIFRELDDSFGEGVYVEQVDLANVHPHRMTRRVEHRLCEVHSGTGW